MQIPIRSKYLVFSVNSKAAVKRMSFQKEGKEVYYLDIGLDKLHPDYQAYVDVSRFAGEELTLDVAPDMPVTYWEADTMDIPELYISHVLAVQSL